MDKTYEAPQLTVVGSVESLTAASTGGGVTDRTFPAGTPIPVITTS